ncbi:MAG: DedA family protein [Deltaproteobacteria bacterium]|nr:MAG: DedA family protein [Deltaproteobacteria bacterium]
MEQWLLEYGYPALFLLSFLASTLVPLGSEWLLGVLLLNGFDPTITVLVATLGNSCGALTTYAIGLWGGPYLTQRFLRISPESQGRAEHHFNRYGSWALLFSWLPVIGDPLCLVGGVLRTGFWRFVLLVSAGKFVRYLVVAKLVLEGTKTL